MLNPNVHSPEESGKALAWLAVGKEVEGESGKYFEGMRQIKSSVESYEVEKQQDLWEWTAKFVAMDEGEARAFEKL